MNHPALPNTKPVLMVVSHSHWDREWHTPFQQFRLKLGKMIDSLLNTLASNPNFHCFTLDGQTIILEDYAELRPERIEELRSHIRAGRIRVGPWYVLPDEFLVSGESIIRNLLLGRDIATDFGGYMKVGYLPDQFGHIAQMPQLLSNFGINSAVLWRGVDDSMIESTEFLWRAPDGSEVLAVNIPDGYFNAGGLPTDADALSARVRSIVERLAPKANTRFILLMNGGDHQWPQEELPDIIASIQQQEFEVRHSCLPAYVQGVERFLAEKGVQTEVVTGELRRSKHAHLLPGVLSTRMWIKQRNTACEHLLEKWAEPFTAWAWLETTITPKPSGNGARSVSQKNTALPYENNWRMPLSLAWKYLLQNQPHDSVCGCSIDQVHDEMRVRYDWVEQIGETLVDEALQELSGRIDTDRPAIVVFNPLAGPRTDLVTFKAEEGQGNLVATDDTGARVPCQVIEDLGNQRQQFGFVATGVPGFGYKTFHLRTELPESVEVERVGSPPRIQNEFYVVTPNLDDGTVDILDRTTNRLYKGLNHFSDSGDAGDEYNFDPPQENRVINGPASPSEVTLLEDGPARFSLRINSVLRLPRELSADRKSRSDETVDCPVSTTVSLYPGVRRIDFSTDVDNRAKDHRLRVQFPTGVWTDTFYTEAQYDVLRRDVAPALPKPDWVEDPVATRPQKSFVDVNDADHGLLLANRGLPECEVSPEADGLTISLTLIRCVGWLSRGDLRCRRGDAGPVLPTPGAQCLGSNRFEYALAPHTGSWQEAAHLAHQFNSPLRAIATGAHSGPLQRSLSFISIAPDWVPVSAFKPAHDAQGLIVRLYNPTGDSVEVQMRPHRPIRRAVLVDAKEDPVDGHNTFEVSSGSPGVVRVKLLPKAISSIKLYYS